MNARLRLLEETLRVWGDASALRPAAGAPAPGDVVASGDLADFDVEWAVLDARSPDRLLVVAADGQPLVGSTDVEVPASAPGGPLVLRCRFGGWVDAGRLGAVTRTGALAPGDLARARNRRAEVELAAHPAGSILAQETDDDPEYRAWVSGTLEPAWRTLAGQGPAAALEQPGAVPEDSGTPYREPRRSRARRSWNRPRLLLLAATVLVGFGAALFWRQHQELLDQRAAVRARQNALDELLRERDHLRAEHQRRLEEAGAERGRLESDARRQLDELRRRLDDAVRDNVVVNPVVTSLDPPGQRRGREKRLRVGAGASHVLLAVELEEPKPGLAYRAELLGSAGDNLWTSHELREELGGLWIGLPTALLPTGDYLLRIFEPGPDGPELTAEYPLGIHRTAGDR